MEENYYIELHNKKYCQYCGKEIKAKEIFNGDEFINIYECSCEDFIKARNINNEIYRLMQQLPKKQYYKGETILKYQQY